MNGAKSWFSAVELVRISVPGSVPSRLPLSAETRRKVPPLKSLIVAVAGCVVRLPRD